MRIIISEKKPVAPTSVHVDGDITSSKIENGNISEMERQATDSSDREREIKVKEEKKEIEVV